MKFNILNRSIHRWGSIVIAIPFLIILITGILLLLRKEIAFLQPPTVKIASNVPTISFERILTSAQLVEPAGIKPWEDIDRLDVRPSKGIIKIRAKSQWEIQIYASTGVILQTAYRRSDFIEKIHDGTYWQDNANLWLTLPIAITLLIISITGIILFFMPYLKKRKNNKRNTLY